jgi:uncharacterized membrane protein YphA (DoxX/SURF4 family)
MSDAGLLNDLLATEGLAASVAIGLIFVTAGAQKLRHRAVLPGVIAHYRILPEAAVGPVAALLPVLEIGTGVALVAGIVPLAAVAGIVLLLLFTGAMAVNIARGRSHIDCGCGDATLRQSLSPALVMRNLLLAGLLLPRLLPAEPQSPVALFTAVAAGVGGFLAYQLFQTVAALMAAHPVASRR